MSPGFDAAPPGMFSVVGTSPMTLSLGFSSATARKRAEHARRAAHVELHLVHLGGGLERDAAGVEGDPLADEHHRLRVLRPAVVAELDELRRLARALRDREQRAHPELFHVAPLEHFDAELLLAGELLRLLREIGRGADVAGQVAEILGERDAGRDRAALGGAALRGRFRRLPRDPEHDRLERARRRLLALHRVEAVERLGGAERGMTRAPRRIALLHRQLAERRARARPRRCRRPRPPRHAPPRGIPSRRTRIRLPDRRAGRAPRPRRPA